MRTVYFTNTASTGEGSLRNAVIGAMEGDVIMPDPEIFEAGENFTITLGTALRPTTAVILDAGKTRPTLEYSSILIQAQVANGCAGLSVTGFTLKGRVIVSGDSSTQFTARFTRCVFGSNQTSAALLQCSAGYTDLTCNDCLFCGSLSYPLYLNQTSSSYTFNHCTIAANLDRIYGNGAGIAVFNDCIKEPDLATAGFCNVPATMEGYSVSNLPPWQTWDFALLPTSQYATGASGAAGACDLDGNARGWNASGNIEYAFGAYEVVNADYFLRRLDVEEIDFTDETQWATARGGNISPSELGEGVYYISQNAAISGHVPDGVSIHMVGRSSLKITGVRNFAGAEFGVDAEIVFMEDKSALVVNGDAELVYGTVLKSNSAGYLMTSNSVDADSLELHRVNVGRTGGELSSFSATSRYSTSITLEWYQQTDVPILIEVQNQDGTWELVSNSNSSGELTVPLQGNHIFRAFDGVNFFVDSAWTATAVQFKVISDSVFALEPSGREWGALVEVVSVGDNIKTGQAVTILARIYDAFDNTVSLKNTGDNIRAVKYTCEKQSKFLYSNEYTAIEGHTDVSVSTNCVLEAPQTSDAWTYDETGYNFVLSPDISVNPLFAEAGTYRFKVTVTPEEGNPIVFYHLIAVE